MGDLANMTDYDGRMSGERLLRWLRSRERVERVRSSTPLAAGAWGTQRDARVRADLLKELADDLAAELTPPDYPEDDGGGDSGFTAEHYRLLDGLTAPNNEDADEGDRDTGPCEGCGRPAALVPVSDNGRVWLACPACAARTEDDTVDLDDPALTNGPEQGPPEGPAYRDFAPGREDDPEAYREMVQQERAEEEAGLSIRRRKQE